MPTQSTRFQILVPFATCFPVKAKRACSDHAGREFRKGLLGPGFALSNQAVKVYRTTFLLVCLLALPLSELRRPTARLHGQRTYDLLITMRAS